MAELYIPRGTIARSKVQAIAILDDWLRYSNAATIGDAKYGAKSWMTIIVAGRRFVMNSNTNRRAVMHLVVLGHHSPWFLVDTNPNGARRRVVGGPPRKKIALDPNQRVQGMYIYYRGRIGENVPASV